LQEFVSENKLSGAICRAVLPTDQYRVYPVEKPQVEESELAEAARWKVKDVLEYDLADAVTDVYEFPADALRGRPEQVDVVATRSTLIKNIVDLSAAAGLELQTIDIAELALRNVIALEGEEDRASALLYLRNGQGIMILCKGQTLYFSRKFDFSVHSLNDVSQQDSVLQHLSLEVQRSFDYFESQMGQVPPPVVHLVGPSMNLPLANMLGGLVSAQVKDLESINEILPDGLNNDVIECLVALGSALRQDEVA